MKVYLEHHKESTKKLPRPSEYINMVRYKVSIQISFVFQYITNKSVVPKIKIPILFTTAHKNEIPGCKSKETCIEFTW